jgi:hypothetical protein
MGYLNFARAPTRGEVATPLHVKLIRPHGRTAVQVSFTARLPVTDAHRLYVLRWTESSMPPGAYGGTGTNSNLPAGHKITLTIGDPFRPLRPGVIRGTVSLLQAVGAGGLEGPGSVRLAVGSFTVRVP